MLHDSCDRSKHLIPISFLLALRRVTKNYDKIGQSWTKCPIIWASCLVKMYYKMGTDRPSSSKNSQLQTDNSWRLSYFVQLLSRGRRWGAARIFWDKILFVPSIEKQLLSILNTLSSIYNLWRSDFILVNLLTLYRCFMKPHYWPPSCTVQS